jgi:sulfite dehydrogenase (cytochrome) subunit B
MKQIAIVLLLACCAATSGAADKGFTTSGTERSIELPPPEVALKEGKGMEVTKGYCSICHSLDYITTQPKFPKTKWEAEVNKMIKVFGAPIDAENAKVIVNYISYAYGK